MRIPHITLWETARVGVRLWKAGGCARVGGIVFGAWAGGW